MAPRKLAAGNWKMNGDLAALSQIDALITARPDPGCDVLICPPALLIQPMKARIGAHPIALGGQDCHARAFGAHTGDIAAVQLKDAGADYVILGHSERREYHKEFDVLVNAKAKAALTAGLKPIVCVGETLAQREGGQTDKIVGDQIAGSLAGLDNNQLKDMVIAYEPVWAIGTGKTATPEQAQEMHAFIRSEITESHGEDVAKAIRIQYGGSVKPANARELLSLPDVDGALVGGASLEVRSFTEIITNTLN